MSTRSCQSLINDEILYSFNLNTFPGDNWYISLQNDKNLKFNVFAYDKLNVAKMTEFVETNEGNEETSIFSFSNKVSKSYLYWSCLNSGLFGERLNVI